MNSVHSLQVLKRCSGPCMLCRAAVDHVAGVITVE
jgi:hypothetical protein